MWPGYFEIGGGVELINVARTEAYAENAGLRWFIPAYKCDGLRQILDDDPYTMPAADPAPAPWYDPRVPHSGEFYGVYPLDVTGLDDATGTASSQQNVTDGATLTAVRRNSKVGVFTCLLIAASDAGAEYGKQWLTRALLGPCGPGSGSDGLTLTYCAAEPVVGPWTDEAACSDLRAPRSSDPYTVSALLMRSLRGASVITSPQVTAKKTTSDKGAVWYITFSIEAGNPYEFGIEVPFVEQWLDPGAASIWPEGTPPAGASVTGPTTIAEEECIPATYSPLYDPLCPGVVPPPNPPAIDWACYVPPASWNRYKAVIPQTFVPGWTEAVPIITFAAAEVEARNVRIRIYADPDGTGNMDPLAPCNFVADIVVGYVPAEHTMIFDSADRVVYVDSPDGQRRRADNLVYASDGGPFEWPELTCGQQYVLMLDIDPAEVAPYLSVSLVERLG